MLRAVSAARNNFPTATIGIMNTLPRISSVEALPDYRLSVVFDNGKAVVYDVREDMEQIEEFRLLKQVPHLWEQMKVDGTNSLLFVYDRLLVKRPERLKSL